MKTFNASPLELHNSEGSFVDPDSDMIAPSYKKKGLFANVKRQLKQLLIFMQTAIIWSMFLYIPLYAGLLYFKVITFISLFSLYYFISYIAIIIVLIMINYEKNTFK